MRNSYVQKTSLQDEKEWSCNPYGFTVFTLPSTQWIANTWCTLALRWELECASKHGSQLHKGVKVRAYWKKDNKMNKLLISTKEL